MRLPNSLALRLASLTAPLALTLLHGCSSEVSKESEAARKLGITVAEASAFKSKKQVTDADLLAMPRERFDSMVERSRAPRHGFPRAAEQWRLMSLRDENGQIPHNALLAAKAEMDALAGDDQVSVGGLLASAWTNLGPTNIGGRTRAIAIHPTTPTTIFAGSVAGGIWRSLDSGASWARVGDAMTNLAITTIVFAPGLPSVLYAGTGEGFGNADSVRGAGIWKSVDGGATWSQLPSTNTSNFYYVNQISISPNGATLLAATRTGVWRSTDGGNTFTKTLGTINAESKDVEFHPSDNLRAVADFLDYDFGIASWYSTTAYTVNGGVSWSTLTTTMRTNGFSDRTELAWHRGYTGGGGGCVYAQKFVQSTGSTQLYRSLDGGATYTLVSSNAITGNQGWYDNAVWVNPADVDADPANDLVVVGGIDAHRSTNGGATFTRVSNWTQWPTSAHADHHRIVEHPQYNGTTNRIVYFGNDGGIWRANDVTTVAQLSGWTNLNNGYSVTQFYGGSRNEAAGILIGGTQDNGTLRTTTSASWTTMFGGDGGFCASDPTNSSYHYGEYVNLQIHRSTNGGLTSSSIYGPISGGNFIAPFVLDPNNANTMLAGGDALWRSVNVKATTPTWTNIKAGTGQPISAIAVVPGNSAIVYVGHNDGSVYKSTDATAAAPTWTKIDDNATPLPGRFVTRIVIDPFNANRVYVLFGGYVANNVWLSNNGGSSWGALGLPPVAPIRDLEVHEANPSWLYLATEVGLLVSTNGGLTWSSGATPARVSIDEMFWSDHHLYLVTHGLGMWRQSPFATAAASSAGSGCVYLGAATGPTLTGNAPAIGTTWIFSMTGAPLGGLAALMFSNTPAAPTLLSPGCFAQVDLATMANLGLQAVNAGGGAAWILTVPDNPFFCGVSLTMQAVTLSGGSYHLSNGRVLSIGL